MVGLVFPAVSTGICEGSGGGPRLLEDAAQPVDTSAGEVGCGGPDRPEVGSRPELELCERERADSRYKALVGELPALIETDQTL
jgi:hypothetical protein